MLYYYDAYKTIEFRGDLVLRINFNDINKNENVHYTISKELSVGTVNRDVAIYYYYLLLAAAYYHKSH